MSEVYICDGIRTPVGRYAGALASIRPDDLAAGVLRSLMKRNPSIDWERVDDVILGCANQAGEDNRNVARMSALLAGIPVQVPGLTVNRLCGSGMDAIVTAARQIALGDADLVVAGGVESMSRAPFVTGKAGTPYDRSIQTFDTTMGWRFVNSQLTQTYGTETMPETAENVAADFKISRESQDCFALLSQDRYRSAADAGYMRAQILPIQVKIRKNDEISVEEDEHPRNTTFEALSRLRPIVRPTGTVTAGNSSGINDGAAALILASSDAVKRYNLKPLVRYVGGTSAGVEPRIMGIGPVTATRRLLGHLNMTLDKFDVFEWNEAFAAQVLAVIRLLGLEDTDPRINAWGGAIAIGHPLGMSGARILLNACHRLVATRGRYGLCNMCIGVGQGISVAIEHV